MALECGCRPDRSGYGHCPECVKALRKKIWREMSPERKAYDRCFAPGMAADLDRACEEDDD